MDAKHLFKIQTCSLSKKELTTFLVDYPIPSQFKVMLPKNTQTILDAPEGFMDLYINSFTWSNLRFPLPKLFCEVLNYYQVHISRFNPFGLAKLTTFAVFCKAYWWSLRCCIDKKSFKDPFPRHMRSTVMYQCLSTYPVDGQTFPGPILYFVCLQTSWEHSPANPVIIQLNDNCVLNSHD